MDFDTDDSLVVPLVPEGLSLPTDWTKYPQNLFGNWTPDQVKRSKMLTTCSDSTTPCSIHTVEVNENGHFDKTAADRIVTVTADAASVETFWSKLQEPVRITLTPTVVDRLN